MIRSFGQADVSQPCRRVGQQRFSASIAEAEKLAQHETGKELGECKIMSRELAGMLWQRGACELIGDAHHHPWRLAGQHPPFCSWIERLALLNKRLTSKD